MHTLTKGLSLSKNKARYSGRAGSFAILIRYDYIVRADGFAEGKRRSNSGD
jgi:hypothetical protein